MVNKVTLTSNNGMGWYFGDGGLQDVTFKTEHGYAWSVTEESIDENAVVTNNGEDVTHNGEVVTSGA